MIDQDEEGFDSCRRCLALVDLRYGDEPTDFCDHCAQDIAAASWALVQQLRESNYLGVINTLPEYKELEHMFHRLLLCSNPAPDKKMK
jgi:hypothetical protein